MKVPSKSRNFNVISAVIPTRNRPHDLIKAVVSICVQTRPPDEFIIVDQSPDEKSRALSEAILSGHPHIKLIYVHDPRISGLVEAKHVAAQMASGDLVCFLEDDVVLEPEYVEQIEAGFAKVPGMIGCCGIITNPPSQNFAYRFMFKLFHHGIFRDERIGVYGQHSGMSNKLIPSVMLSGGVSAWRSGVFSVVHFDIVNGFHMLEDIDFSTRVAKSMGPYLYINPNARLAHFSSPINREVLGPRQRRKLREFFVYYKKRRNWPSATIPFVWLLVGLFLEAAFQSVSARSFGPLLGYLAGVRDGIKIAVVL